MTTGKIIALTIWTCVRKLMSLFFNMLSRFVIAFKQLSRFVKLSFKGQAFFFFNFMASVTICSDFGAQENKVCHCFHCFTIYLPWSDETGWQNLSFLNVDLRGTRSLAFLCWLWYWSYMAYILLSYVPPIHTFWRVFIINRCQIMSKAPSASI